MIPTGIILFLFGIAVQVGKRFLPKPAKEPPMEAARYEGLQKTCRITSYFLIGGGLVGIMFGILQMLSQG